MMACDGNFVDAGGPGGGYGPNQNYTATICSDFSNGNPSIKLYFNQFDIDPSDTLYIYDGIGPTDPLIGAYNNTNSLFLHPVQATVMNWTGCLTVAFQSNHAVNGGGWQADISCIPLCQQVYCGMDTTLTYPLISDTGYITICEHDTIHFAGMGVYPQNNILYLQNDTSSTFVWSFGDGVTDTGQIVDHVYDSVRGYDVQLTVIDEQGCVSTNALQLRVCIADNPIGYFQQPPAICQYDTLTLKIGYGGGSTFTLNPIHYEQSSSLMYDSATFIPDGGAIGGMCYNTNVTFNVFNPGQTVLQASDIQSVSANMEHSYMGDLEMLLVCPNGQQAIVKEYIQSGHAYLGIPYGGENHSSFDCTSPPACLSDPTQNPAGEGWTYNWTTVSPEYNTMQTYGSTGNCTPLPPGISNPTLDSSSYMPFQNFTNLIGCPLNGTWNFQVCDYWGADNGWVFWWQLNLDANLLPSNWGYTCLVDSAIWTGPDIIGMTDTTMTIAPSASGIFTYQLTVYDHFGCNYDTSFTLQVNPAPQPNLGADTTLCEGESVTLTAHGGGTYQWNNGATVPEQSVTPSDTTQYTVIVTSSGCHGYDTLVVNVNPIPVAHAGPDTAVCLGQSLVLHGSGGTQYQWSNGTLDPNLPLQPSSTTLYWLTVTTNGCSSTDTVLVVVNPLPYPKLGADTALCDLDTLVLNPGGFSAYAWSTGETTPTITIDTTGDYWVRVWNEFGCTRSDTMHLLVNSIPKVNMDFSPDHGCEPVLVSFTNYTQPPALTYLWEFGDGKTSDLENPIHTYTSPGLFSVILTAVGNGGCEKTDTFPQIIRIYKTPEASFYPSPASASILNPVISFINMSNFTDTYSWEFGDGGSSDEESPLHTYSDTGYYAVTLLTTTGPGCADTAYSTVHIKDYVTIYIPNAFSPNDDGHNDFFGPLGTGWGTYKVYSMAIFNRWGTLIFETDNPAIPWNGKVNNSGKVCQDGSYIYRIRLQAEDNNIKEYKGQVLLIR